MTADNNHHADADSVHDLVRLTRLSAAQEPAELLVAFVTAAAPRLFALIDEPDEQPVGRILAWGLQFDDFAHIVAYDGALSGAFASAERSRRLFAHQATTIRLVWCSPIDNPGCPPASGPSPA